MVSVYALICSATVAQSDCSVENAIDVVRLPDADNPMNCLQGAMMTLAGLAVQPIEGQYWKVICNPPSPIEEEIARQPRASHHHRG